MSNSENVCECEKWLEMFDFLLDTACCDQDVERIREYVHNKITLMGTFMNKDGLTMNERLIALETLYAQVSHTPQNYNSYIIVLNSIMILSNIEKEEVKKKGLLLS